MTRGKVFERFGIPRPDEETRRAAIEDPGPSWKEYFYFDFLKVWLALGLLIVDVLILASFVQPLMPVLMVLAIVPAVYLEFLLYRYLWRRPTPEELARPRLFRRTWLRPVSVGRWTPERFRLNAGLDPDPEGLGKPDPKEFL